jgi:hypothetical protein
MERVEEIASSLKRWQRLVLLLHHTRIQSGAPGGIFVHNLDLRRVSRCKLRHGSKNGGPGSILTTTNPLIGRAFWI